MKLINHFAFCHHIEHWLTPHIAFITLTLTKWIISILVSYWLVLLMKLNFKLSWNSPYSYFLRICGFSDGRWNFQCPNICTNNPIIANYVWSWLFLFFLIDLISEPFVQAFPNKSRINYVAEEKLKRKKTHEQTTHKNTNWENVEEWDDEKKTPKLFCIKSKWPLWFKQHSWKLKPFSD